MKIILWLLVSLWLYSSSHALPGLPSDRQEPPGFHDLVIRDDCKTETVASGDGCGDLAERCGISGADLEKYNPDPNLCSSLAVGQRVCCTSGNLPDIRPPPEANGTCASYVTKEGDSCAAIAAANGLNATQLENFNKVKVWGFDSCENLGAEVRICLSEGDAPLPATQENAICGPTMPGTEPPASGTNISDLNPCPLNACCNIWGQCGITGEFCVPTTGEFGNPGVGPPGSNGCASSCGREITNNNVAPTSFISVGYYESWNMDRPCLTMKAKAVTSLQYTHMHWGFGKIAEDMSVSVNDTYKQWDDFKRLSASGIKTVLSFGGWGDSTDPATYDILRTAVSPEGRETFTDNVASFAREQGLDGVDIDWEYPGAADIPGIPPGQKEDGENYLAMLEMLRSKLDDAKTLSIAAPASYWYLRPFPIANISKSLDYIVYMTYDLHGQWDAGNKYAQEGCPGGNCLRSHVNLTETMDSLAMITKAGVSTTKIVVGISSYGRSFKMADPNCSGPMCTFLGSNTSSPAEPGECTQTAGYISNAEISSIMKKKPESKVWHDNEVDADLIVYDSTEWASYMTEETKTSRAGLWKDLNFAGTIDWAVDLQAFSEDDGCPAGTCDSPGTLYVDPEIFTGENPAIECNAPCLVVLPPFILPEPTTVSFPPMTTSLEVAWTETTTATGDDGEITTRSSISRVVQTTTITVPAVTTTAIDFWNNPVQNGSNATLMWLTWSILPPPFVITDDPNPEHTSGVTHSKVTRTIYPPPWPYSFKTPTTTPTPTITHDSSTLHSSLTIKTQTGEPGPKCTSNCGHTCKLFCHRPCLPGSCPPGGGNPEFNDFWDPADPNPPPGPPPGSNPDPPGGGGDICQPEVKTETGLCSNGNTPVWDPVSMTVRCDLSSEQAEDQKTECQREIDADLEKAQDDAGRSSQCCANPAAGLQSADNIKQRAPQCPVPPNFPQNPPANGVAHSTFTCSFNRWPNVCANARSAILKRGKPAVLTYDPNDNHHKNALWYNGKSIEATYGWALEGCEVEEYPFASGDPIRNPNGANQRAKLWSEERVLRLIPGGPGGENGDHGTTLAAFYRQAGNGDPHLAAGLIYSMAFEGGPTGTSDDDFYLGTDTSRNICAQPYGNAFILVNAAANMAPNERSYDPWWDNKLIHKTVSYMTNGAGTATSSVTADIPRQYCRYPSPGRKIYNQATGQWEVINPANAEDRRMGNRYYKCDNYPGYSGPPAIPPVRRRRTVVSGDELLIQDGLQANVTEAYVIAENDTDASPSRHLLEYLDSRSRERSAAAVREERDLSAPKAISPGSGSFLDPSAWLYLCNDAEDGVDPCAGTYSCGSSDDSDGLGDDGGWGPSPTSPTTTAEPPSPTTTTEPPAPPPTPEASCDITDDNGLAWRIHVFNIRNWAEKDDGAELKKQEQGCGALTFWDWTDETEDEGASVWFDLPLFIKSGCVERAIKSAGGPDVGTCNRIRLASAQNTTAQNTTGTGQKSRP